MLAALINKCIHYKEHNILKQSFENCMRPKLHIHCPVCPNCFHFTTMNNSFPRETPETVL